MSTVHSTRLEVPAGSASREVGRILAYMDEQHTLLTAGTRDLSPEDLCWQPAPGMNTIGMLLAHIAYAEAHMTQVGVLGEATGHAHDVVGITEEDEGLPLPPRGAPSAALEGRPFEFFDDLLARTRAHTRAALLPLRDEDLERIVRRPPRPDGSVREFNIAWLLHHLLEHIAGHRSQIALLRHLRQATRAA